MYAIKGYGAKKLYEDQGPGLGIGYQLFSFNCINVNFNYS